MTVERPSLPPPIWKRFIETLPGIRLCCRCYGVGEKTLVLLHGNGEDARCFFHQIEAFSAQYRVLLVESRGHGSSSNASSLTLEEMASDLEHVLHALSIERVSIVGFSDGGNVALYFALKYPQHLDRMVLAGSNLSPEGLDPRMLRKLQWQWWWWQLWCRAFQHARHKATLLELMVFQPQISAADLVYIKAPTLVLTGARDIISMEHTQLIADSLPHSRLRIIPSCGHFIFTEQPRWVNETILRFLAGDC